MDYEKRLEEQNKKNLNELVEYIDKNLVVPFVGAGLSAPIYPLWGRFFSNVLDTIMIRRSAVKEIQELLSKNEYEQAASLLERSIGKAQYVSIIKNTFSQSKIPNDDTLKDMAISILPQIFKNNTVITTNFDRLLNKVFGDAGYEFKGDITPYEDSEVAKGDLLQGTVNYLLKLHGDYLHADKIVFTKEQYDTCYGKNLDSRHIAFLSKVLSSKVLLFLGCSLETDRTMKLLEKIALKEHRIHYAIVENPFNKFDDDEFFDKAERLSEIGINCIWYPKGKHEHVYSFLNEIKKKLNFAPPSNPPQVITTTLVQKPSKDFLGRENEIKLIKENLSSNTKLVLVNGMGGIGKTQICSTMFYNYLDSNSNEIRYLAWISYDKDLKSSFFQKVNEIKGIEEINDYFEASKHFFQRLGNQLLLFIDNANNLIAEDQKLISSLACKVIVTSRNKDFNESFKPIEINRLSESDCIDLYLKTLGKEENRTSIKEIIQRADRHTVTVVLLAKTQKSAGMTAEQLLASIKKSGLNLSSIKENVKHEDENTVFMKHLTKLFKIVDLSDGEIRILKLFSLFPYEPLGQNHIKQWFELESYNEVNSLVDKGWIMKDGNNCLFMHPVISSVVKANYKITFKECEQMVENIANTISYTSFENYTEKRLFFPFSISVAEYFKIEFLCNEILGTLFSNVGRVYQDQGEYDKALEFFNKVLEICEEVLGTEHPDTATTYNNLAGVYQDQGKYDKAFEFNKKALAIREKVLGTEHLDTAMTYNNLAGVYQKQSEYEKSLEFYKKALVIHEKVLGTEHPNTATTYNNLALVYQDQGKYDKAFEFYNKTLIIYEKVLGTEHPDTATTYNNLALVYQTQGEYGKALELNKKVLEIREKVLGTEHPDTAMTYNNLAVVYQTQGEYDKALEFYNKALAISKKVFGIEHSYTATTYNNLAGVYKAQGKYDKALKFNKKSLEICEKVLGTEHPDTAKTYNDLAEVYQDQGKYAKASEFYNKALEIREEVLGAEHPDTATSYNNLAGVYKAQGKYDKALEFDKKALVIREKVFGTEHPSTATTYNNLAGVYQDQREYDKALEFYKKSLEIYKKVLGRKHPSTATSYNNLAGVYQDQGEYDKALEFNKKALEIYEKALGTEHPDTAITYNNLAVVYQDQGKYDKALKFYNKALAIFKTGLGERHSYTINTFNNLQSLKKKIGID